MSKTFAAHKNLIPISFSDIEILGHFVERPFMSIISNSLNERQHDWTHEIFPFKRIPNFNLLDLLQQTFLETLLFPQRPRNVRSRQRRTFLSLVLESAA